MNGLEAGSTLGGYEILARLRAGAMGVLYLARRAGPGGFARPVAIKVIHEHLAQNKRFCRMFIAEAKLSARIDDPHVVRVEEFGEADGRYYLVMEFVHGVSLAQAIGVLRKRGGLPLEVAVRIAMDVASGLHAAHEATDEDGVALGIVHRDVSPHNVLVAYKGYVKVIDFGIAKAKEGAGQTLTGSIRGKLAYMPPEQARSAKHVDRRADLYALGLVLWEMLSGRRMFDGTNDIALLNQIKNPIIVAPSAVNARVPKELDEVVLQLLQQDPEKRPPTGAAVARMLGDAWPAATKVLAADVAAVMNDVRDAATTQTKKDSQDEEEDDGSGTYGEEVKKGLTIFGRSMHESVEAADGVLEGLESGRDVEADAKRKSDEDDTKKLSKAPAKAPALQNETEVMLKAPVARPRALGKDTIKMGPPSVMLADVAEEETTQRANPPVPAPATPRHPRQTGGQVRTVVQADNPYLQHGAAPPPPRAPSLPSLASMFQGMMPAWVTPPVMVLAPLTLALAVALVIVQCRSRGDDARSARTTQAVADRSGTHVSPPPPSVSALPAVPTVSPLIPPQPPPVMTLADPQTAPAPIVTNPAAAPTAAPKTGPGKPRPANEARTPLDKAREAALEGNPAAVRALLEGRVRSGHATVEEARLLRAACKQMGDSSCADDVNSKYPSPGP